MYRFQTLTKDQLTNAILCFADRFTCNSCPCKKECFNSPSTNCEKMIFDYLTGEIPQPKTPDFYEGFNEGFTVGYDACKRDIIDKLQKGRKKSK